MKHLHGMLTLLLLAGLVLLLASCEQKSSTGSAPTGPTGIIGSITLTPEDLQLYSVPGTPVTTNITATVTDTNGTALVGIPVHFTAPAFGSISTTLDSTDLNGTVTVTFSSNGQFGLATISASVTSGGIEKSASISIGVYPLTGLATNIYLALDPNILYLSPGVDDSIKVSVWVYDSLGVGIPGLQVGLSTTPTLGVISIADTTNGSGAVVTYVHTIGEYGMGLVTASVNTSLPDTLTGAPPSSGGAVRVTSGSPALAAIKTGAALAAASSGPEGTRTPPSGLDDVYTITKTDTFWIFPVDQQIYNLILSASPGILNVAPDSAGSATITAIVLDQNNNGVPGVPVAFATNLGILTANAGVTNSAGIKTVSFQSIPNLYGMAQVWAVVGGFSDTTQVIVSPTASANGLVQAFTSTHLIYADGGITYANVTALLKDADNQVISNASIIFTSDYGTVNSPVLTDSTGQAHALFTGILGFPSYPESSLVIAKYTPLNIADSLHIMIAPARLVDHIVLSVGDNTLTANNTDSTGVNATVYLEGNALASPGTSVNFIVAGDNIGRFPVPVGLVGMSGTASVYYFAGNQTGIDTLLAEVDSVYSNPVAMYLVSGPPSEVSVNANPTVLYVNSMQMSTITATVTDTSGNLVEDNWGVTFTTTLGSISPQQAPTINGVATAFLAPASSAGAAYVVAQVGLAFDSILVTIEPSSPAYINLSTQFPTITVAGAGSNNQTQIYAHVNDAAGNPVANDVLVHFEIANLGFPYGGVNLNFHGYQDSTSTNNGIATVVLNAGSNPGPVQIHAWTMVDTLEISAQQSLVSIVAGPPATIDINSMSDPQDGGGDAWIVEVSALVLDALGNEVPDGTTIQFYLIQTNTTAQIQAGAPTGNHNWAGDSLAGVAYTTLTYQSNDTFQPVTLVAYCMVGGDSVVGTREYELPLANGDLSLVVDPIAWNFDHWPVEWPTGNPARMECIALLKDGHQLPINGGVIIFFSTRGYFHYYSSWPANPNYWSSTCTTGPNNGPPYEPNDAPGYATLWLLTTFEQAFPDPGAFENTATVHCQVMGYFDVSSDAITVTYTKDALDNP